MSTSRAGAARAAAILLMSCHRQSIKGASKHRRALSDVAEGSTDGLGRHEQSILHSMCVFFLACLSVAFVVSSQIDSPALNVFFVCVSVLCNCFYLTNLLTQNNFSEVAKLSCRMFISVSVKFQHK